MKFVIFSDIHGNFKALQQMLKATSNLEVDGYIFCGDLVGYLCEQEEIVDVFKFIFDVSKISEALSFAHCILPSLVQKITPSGRAFSTSKEVFLNNIFVKSIFISSKIFYCILT